METFEELYSNLREFQNKKFDIGATVKSLEAAQEEMVNFHTASNPDSSKNIKAIKSAIASLKKIKNF